MTSCPRVRIVTGAPCRPWRTFVRLLSTSVAVALIASAVRAGQVGASGDELSRATLEARLAAVEADTTLEPAAREARRELIQQSLRVRDDVDRWIAEQLRLEADRLAAPERIAALQAELDRAEPPGPLEPAADLPAAESALGVARAELDALRAEVERLDQEQRRRVTRRSELPDAMATARQMVQQRRGERIALGEVSPEDEAGDAATDAVDLARVRLAFREAQLAALEEEQRGASLLDDLVNLQVRAAGRRVKALEVAIEARLAEVESLRRIETERAQGEAGRAARLVGQVPTELRDVAERNAVLAGQVTGRLEGREQLARLHADVRAARAAVVEAHAAAARREEVAGLSDAIGALLRKEKADLPRVRDIEQRLATRRDEMAGLRLEGLQASEELELLADLDVAASELVAARTVSTGDLADGVRAARELLEIRAGYLRELAALSDTVFVELAAVAQDELGLVDAVQGFRRFIDERILWIRSSQPIWAQDFSSVPALLAWLADPRHWVEASSVLLAGALRSPAMHLGLVAGLGLLFWMRPRMRRALAAAGERARIRRCQEMSPTWRALGASAVLICGVPALLATVGWRLGAEPGVNDFPKALGVALQGAALVVLITEGLRVVFHAGGLAHAHFGWSESAGRRLRVPSFTLLLTAVPSLGLAMLIEAQDEAAWKGSVGRVLFALALLAFSVFLHLQVRGHRRSGELTSWQRHGWFGVHVAAVALPGALAAMALGAYAFTAIQLLDRLLLTATWSAALVLAYALTDRALLLAKRRLRMRELKRNLAKRGGVATAAEEDAVDLARVDAQSRQAARALAVAALLVGSWFIWADVLPALHLLDRVELWSYSVAVQGEDGLTELVPVTLGRLLVALSVLFGMVMVNRNLPGMLELILLQRLPLGPGERYAIKAVLGYLVTLAGVIWAFGTIGVSWSQVQWLAAAMSVGLGFGLQEIFANFVSGLIILGERPVRVGDWVTAGDVTGKVAKIRMRATTLIDRDNCEWLVPNRQFITGNLSNWTLSDQITRVVLPVGVAYGSDTELASEILLDVARSTPGVMGAPEPNTVFMGFGDNSLDLELRFYITGRDGYPGILDPVNTRIHKRFAEAGIEIAFPQRDLHIRSAPGLLDAARIWNAPSEPGPASSS